MLSGFPPVHGPLRLLADAGPVQALQFARLLPTSAVSLGRRLFESGGARAWLYGAAMHGDAPVLKPGSAIAGVYLNLLGHAVGWPSPRGGAGRLTDALVGYLRSARRRGPHRHTGRADHVQRAAGRRASSSRPASAWPRRWSSPT